MDARTISVPGDYVKIQWAIDNASSGDTIEVHAGTYYENVNATKRLILRGIGNPVVNASGNGSAFTLAADGIILEGFTATGAGFYPWAGIAVTSNNNALIGNNASYNGYGNTFDLAFSYGILLSSSNNNTLIGNNASNNGYGNTFEHTAGYGIYLSSSSNNTLIGNNANSNNNGIGPGEGFYLSSSSNNTLFGNNANSNSDGIYLTSSSNNTLISNTASLNNGPGFGCNHCYGDGVGIYLSSSSNNTLNGNNASSNYDRTDRGGGIGILLYYHSNNNTLVSNTASLNNGPGGCNYCYNNGIDNSIGIALSSTSNNNLIYNNIFNNTINVWNILDNEYYLYGSGNINNWNITKRSGTNIIGGFYIGGNFWAYPNGTGFSQTCMDADKDGICDSPYVLDVNNTDYLPLLYKPIISDAISPVINSVTLNTTTPLTGQAILVIVNATDNVGVTGVVANGASLTVQGGNTFTWSGAITAIEGTHSVNVSARDAADNVAWNNSTSYTATSGPTPPVPELSTVILTLTGLFGILLVSRKYKRT